MTRVSCALLALVGLSASAFAQSQPVVRTGVQPRSVVVGQPVTLDVDVFVPTYFVGAPRFPALEVKDAVVVFLDTGGENLTEKIGDADYAGQRRSYLIYPQRPGDFEVPAFEVKVRFAVDGQPSPRTPVPARSRRFTATLPEAARGLEHFVATPLFELGESTDRPTEGLKVGESFTRTITMTATDAFAMMLPPLSFPPLDGLGVYPAQARVSDTSGERGETRVGKRVESVTYALQRAGEYRLPAIELDWWDTAARRVRRASLPEVVFSVAPNPRLRADIPLPEDPSEKPPPPDPWKPVREALLRFGPGALVSVLVVLLLLRMFKERLLAFHQRRAARLRARQESAAAYLEKVKAAAGSSPAQLLAATYRFLDRLGDGTAAARLDVFARASGDPTFPALADAVVTSGLAVGPDAGPGTGSSREFVEALVRASSPGKARRRGTGGLGLINPR